MLQINFTLTIISILFTPSPINELDLLNTTLTDILQSTNLSITTSTSTRLITKKPLLYESSSDYNKNEPWTKKTSESKRTYYYIKLIIISKNI